MKMCKMLEIISDKKKRVRSRACALTRRTTTAAYIIIYRKFRSNERTTRLARSRSPMNIKFMTQGSFDVMNTQQLSYSLLGV